MTSKTPTIFTPELTLALADLVMASGRAILMMRSMCWDMQQDRQAKKNLGMLTACNEVLHNLEALGRDLRTYLEGRASGKALKATAEHLLRGLDAINLRHPDTPWGGEMEWHLTRDAIQRVVDTIVIVEIEDDQPTTAEHMAKVMQEMSAKHRRPRKTASAQPSDGGDA